MSHLRKANGQRYKYPRSYLQLPLELKNLAVKLAAYTDTSLNDASIFLTTEFEDGTTAAELLKLVQRRVNDYALSRARAKDRRLRKDSNTDGGPQEV